MNYLRAYTPRIRPLNYDSLRSEVGCLEISGSKVNELLPFSLECVSLIQPDVEFLRSPLVSTFLGPASHLLPEHPFTTPWSAWQASTTIRIGQFATVTLPSNSLGDESRLFAGKITTALSGAFNRLGLLVLAIQKTTGIIQIRRYLNSAGVVANIEFGGVSPALIYMGLVFVSEMPEQSEVACYYLRPEKPGIIFARLESEGFALEHSVNSRIRASPVRLIFAGVEGRQIVLRARDEQGRYLTYSTDPYTLTSADEISLGVTITDGDYFLAGVTVSADSEAIALGATITGGSYFDAIEEPVGEVPAGTNLYTQTAFVLTRTAGTRDFTDQDIGKRYTSTANPQHTGVILDVTTGTAAVDSDLTFTPGENITFSALSSQRLGLNVSITSGEYERAEV